MRPRIVGFWTKLSSLGDPDGIETPGSPPTEAEIDPGPVPVGPVPVHAPVLPAEGVPDHLMVEDTVATGARTTVKEERTVTEVLENPSPTRRRNLPEMTRIKTLSFV